MSYEIVYVDDRSPDGAWDVLVELSESDRHVRAVRLSRNFGQHAAITAGLAEPRAAGWSSWTATSRTRRRRSRASIARLLEGFDIVFARRRRRRDAPLPAPRRHGLLRGS